MANSREIDQLLAREDYDGVVELARARLAKVKRFLVGRLYSADEQEKWHAVRALGALVETPGILERSKIVGLLEQFLWSLSDESGVVPYGVPEAIGEILARRPEFQEQFLPILCSLVTHEDMLQTGAIERGVFWALGRIGPPVATCSSHAVTGIRYAIWQHPDEQTREVATWALAQINQADSPEASPRK
ncbi:MAG: DVU0298 family protein [bacterium]